MIAAARPAGRTDSRLLRVLGASVAGLMLGIGVVATIVNVRDNADTATRAEGRAEVLAYEKRITGPAKEGGFVIQEGLKLGLSQIARNEGGNVMFQAVGWVARLEELQIAFDGAAAGLDDRDLRTAAEKFDEAFLLYRGTAETIGAAAISSGDAREKLLDEAAAKGKAADHRYDEASALLQAVRRDVGLDPTARFPDPATR